MSKTILSFSSGLGYWCDDFNDMSHNTGYEISVLIGEIGDDRNNLLPISKDPYVPVNGDKVFFLPGVNVPRIKFRNLCDETGIRTVRDITKANVFVANNNTLNKLVETTWAYKVKKSDFETLIRMPKFVNKMDTHHLQKMEDALEFYTEKYVFVDRPTVRLLQKYVMKSSREPSQEKITSVIHEFKELLSIVAQAKVYDEGTIIDQLNGEDAAVIDEPVFLQLETMLTSSDEDHKVLAMEIMANCKYSASLIHLMLLFYKHGDIFYSAPTKNHVNFKSLLSWLDLTPSNPNLSADKCVTLLKEKGQLVPEKVNDLLKYIGEDISRIGSTQLFKVRQITLAPELLAEMNTNYSYQMTEDFIPAVPEEEVVPIGEEELPESEFAAEDNFDLEGPEMDQNETEVVEVVSEEVTLEQIEVKQDSEEVKQEDLSNNHQINPTNESSIDWF